MAYDTSQSQERETARTKERPKGRTHDRPAERPATDTRDIGDAMGDKARKGKEKADETPAIKVAETVATAGADGAKHLAVKWIDVWIGNFKPCYFEVSTLTGHGLEVTVEQLAYKKTYTGSGSLTTQPMPVAPIGTKFTLLSRDTTTGEVLEQKGIWYDMSGGGGMSLWALIKKLIWKG